MIIGFGRGIAKACGECCNKQYEQRRADTKPSDPLEQSKKMHRASRLFQQAVGEIAKANKCTQDDRRADSASTSLGITVPKLRKERVQSSGRRVREGGVTSRVVVNPPGKAAVQELVKDQPMKMRVTMKVISREAEERREPEKKMNTSVFMCLNAWVEKEMNRQFLGRSWNPEAALSVRLTARLFTRERWCPGRRFLANIAKKLYSPWRARTFPRVKGSG